MLSTFPTLKSFDKKIEITIGNDTSMFYNAERDIFEIGLWEQDNNRHKMFDLIHELCHVVYYLENFENNVNVLEQSRYQREKSNLETEMELLKKEFPELYKSWFAQLLNAFAVTLFELEIYRQPKGTEEPLRSEILERIRSIASIEEARKHKITREEAIELYRLSGFDEQGNPRHYLMPMAEYFDGKEVELLIVSGEKPAENLIEDIDNLIGPWNPINTRDGQIRHIMIERNIRYDLALDYDNLLHSSESPELAQREMRIWFTEEEINAILNK